MEYGLLISNMSSTYLVSSLWFEIMQDWLSISSDLIVMHFENYQEDLEKQLRRVAKYFNLDLEDKRVSCLKEVEVKNHQRSGKPDLPENIYRPEMVEKFNAVIDKTQELLKKFNHDPLPLSLYKFYSK